MPGEARKLEQPGSRPGVPGHTKKCYLCPVADLQTTCRATHKFC
jgi:hypothetical protein